MRNYLVHVLVSLSALFIVNVSIATSGDFKGDGGGALACGDKALEVLDLYEARLLGYGEPQLGTLAERETMAQAYLNRLSVFSPVRAKLYLDWYHSFEADAVFLDTMPIEDIDDLGTVVPAGCKWLQIVNQNPLFLPQGKKYLIDQNLWKKLSEFQKVGLIFHELIYRESNSETSKGLRLLNGLILVDRLNQLDLSERLKVMSDAGLSWMEAQGLTFQLNSEVQIRNNLLIRARAVNDSVFRWRDQNLLLRPHVVDFYESGSLRALCMSNLLLSEIYGQSLNLDCSEYSDQKIRFYENGQVEASSVDPGLEKKIGPNFELWFWVAAFYPDGKIRQAGGSSGNVQVNGHTYAIKSGSTVGFYPDGKIELFTWGLDESVLTPELYPYWLWDQVVYPRPKYNLYYYPSGALKSFYAGKSGKVKTPGGEWIHFAKDELVNLPEIIER